MFGNYSQIPVNNTVKKILIGKVFSWYNGNTFVILGVRRNNLYGYLEILAGQYSYNKKYKSYATSINVYSWYCFNRRNMLFIGRDNRQAIRNCLKKNPKYIKHHLGLQIDSKRFVMSTQPINYVQGTIVIYDNNNYYKDCLQK